MKKLSIVLLVFVTTMVPILPVARADNQPDTLRVLWTVSDYKILDKSRINEREAVVLLAKPLDISEASITFDGKTCTNIFFQKEDVDSKDYLLSRFNISPQDIGITDPTLQVVRTSCDIPGFSEYIRLPARRLVVFGNGIILFFSPRINY